ncbi:F-box/FBD/LRR-repeat protein At1g13570-like [Silene latifolia]|uniref:F-box/FBD/LRR-repeat protein At1g13570-like n=1 Tax=Silene latifolia TaxID=37657 RepID=UPI003D773FCB
MDISSSQPPKDRISELPDNLLHECLALLEMKNAAQTSILSRRWRYMWTHHLTNLDFDPNSMYPEEYATFLTHVAESRKYFAWINQVVNIHQGPCIDKFRVEFHYYSSCATQLGKWVKFALSKRVKELVLDLSGICLLGDDYSEKGFPLGFDMLRHPPCYTGITALQSLHLQYVNVSQEFIEFLLFHCRHLERLFLSLTKQLRDELVSLRKLLHQRLR